VYACSPSGDSLTERIEYGSKDAADAARERHRDHLCSDDDRRLRTVAFASTLPEASLEAERLEAADSRDDGSDHGAGQVPLTDSERDGIDFSKDRANVAHARSVKGIAQKEGVEDWTAFYDPSLTVDEHRGVMADAARESGSRSAEESVEEKAGRAARAAQSSQCDHARGHCENGDPEACEFLTETCGYSEEEIGEFIDDTPTGENEQQELVTVGGGEYPEMEVTPETAGALRRGWQGYKAGVHDLEAALSRSREAVINARQAWRAVNRIREANGQEPKHPDRLHTLLDALEGMPTSIPSVRTLDHFDQDDATDPTEAMETDDQRTLSGDRSDNQARLAGGERGERGQGEVVDAVEENPGGLLSDKRAESGESGETEQQVPDAFAVAEGGQETL